jgi:hypothetical protein
MQTRLLTTRGGGVLHADTFAHNTSGIAGQDDSQVPDTLGSETGYPATDGNSVFKSLLMLTVSLSMLTAAYLIKDLGQHWQNRLQVCAWGDELKRHKVLQRVVPTQGPPQHTT